MKRSFFLVTKYSSKVNLKARLKKKAKLGFMELVYYSINNTDYFNEVVNEGRGVIWSFQERLTSQMKLQCFIQIIS